MKKTVVIVEDDHELREQLSKILKTAPDIVCIGAYGSGEEALPKILTTLPDVVLMDIKLPGISGIQCVTEIKKKLPDILIIMVTVYAESEQIFHALKAGASGYLSKSSAQDQLIEAIRDVYNGGAPMSGPIARKVVRHFHDVGNSPKEIENLSLREHEVLSLLAKGFIYKEIGDRLKITSETVRGHVKNICIKMHVRGRMEAIIKHHENNLNVPPHG